MPPFPASSICFTPVLTNVLWTSQGRALDSILLGREEYSGSFFVVFHDNVNPLAVPWEGSCWLWCAGTLLGGERGVASLESSLVSCTALYDPLVSSLASVLVL